MTLRLAEPWLLLLCLLPLAVAWARPRRGGAEYGPYALAVATLGRSRGPAVHRLLLAAALGALVVAMARPQFGRSVVEREQAGRDLVLVIDLSPSMQIDDLADHRGERCDRLAGVMAGAKAFVAGRPNDRIGLVFFAGAALTSCPLTYDHQTVLQFLERTEQQQRELWRQEHPGLLGDGTNLGLGLGTALRSLRERSSKGRSAILITDGRDTAGMPGWIDPLVAARHAATTGVTVHCLGVGNRKGTMTVHEPFSGRMRLQPVAARNLPDLARLQDIAKLADGVAFSAGDAKGLDEVFARIDALEPSPQTVREREDYTDRFTLPLLLGALLAALAFVCEPRLRGVA